MGCLDGMVIKNYGGSDLICNLQWVEDVIVVVKMLGLVVSVKMCLGYSKVVEYYDWIVMLLL